MTASGIPTCEVLTEPVPFPDLPGPTRTTLVLTVIIPVFCNGNDLTLVANKDFFTPVSCAHVILL
jgi:hypothetical protein